MARSYFGAKTVGRDDDLLTWHRIQVMPRRRTTSKMPQANQLTEDRLAAMIEEATVQGPDPSDTLGLDRGPKAIPPLARPGADGARAGDETEWTRQAGQPRSGAVEGAATPIH